MNARSSWSHVIFRLCIESKLRKDSELDSSDKSGHAKKPDGFVEHRTKSGSEKGGGDEDVANENVLVSVLNLVDLAGSERVAKTGAEGQRAKEGASINKSLLTLGVVINKLAEDGSKNGGAGGGHVPYRDSKLTRILQPAGGNSKTAIVCAMTPCVSHVEETSSTLRFATRAKNVTNQAKRNEVATATTAVDKETSRGNRTVREEVVIVHNFKDERDEEVRRRGRSTQASAFCQGFENTRVGGEALFFFFSNDG